MAKSDYVPVPKLGYQEECPECGEDIGNADMSAEAVARAKGRHIGSATCKRQRALLQKMLGRALTERGGVVDGDVSGSTEEAMQKARDSMRETVVFRSVAPNLKIMLNRPRTIRNEFGDYMGTETGSWVQFISGEYRTSNAEIIARLRAHRSNVSNMHGQYDVQAQQIAGDTFMELEKVAHKIEQEASGRERVAAIA